MVGVIVGFCDSLWGCPAPGNLGDGLKSCELRIWCCLLLVYDFSKHHTSLALESCHFIVPNPSLGEVLTTLLVSCFV